MMLTRRSVTVGSAALATSALVLGPEALAAPRRRRKTSAEGGQAVLDWQQITYRTVYPTPLRPTIPTVSPLGPTSRTSGTRIRSLMRSSVLMCPPVCLPMGARLLPVPTE